MASEMGAGVFERAAVVTTEALMKDPEKGQIVARRVIELALNTMKAETHLGALADLAIKALAEYEARAEVERLRSLLVLKRWMEEKP